MKGWKLTDPLGQTYNGFKWPIVREGDDPVEVVASGPFTGDGCPRHPGDGLCLARTCMGAQSGGASLTNGLLMLVEYDEADVLSDTPEKYRVKRCVVTRTLVAVDVVRRGKWTAMTGADLRGANLWGALLGGADLGGAHLTEANLREANLRGADLTEANLRRADLTEADLTSANLRGANLTEANLWGVDLRRADLRGASLWGADLRRADLRGAGIRGANPWGANLRGAIANRYTIWPEGFDPDAAGVRREG